MHLTQPVRDEARPAKISERHRAGSLERMQTQHTSTLPFQRRPDLLRRQQRGKHRPIRLSRIPLIRRLLQARRKRTPNITTGGVAANG